MSNKRLNQLESDIELLHDQIAGKRRTLVTIAPEEQIRIEQQIVELRKKLRNFEQEKWELIAAMAPDIAIANDEAEIILAKIVTESEAIAANPPNGTTEEILAHLQKILDKLNELDTTAAAKLKGAISMFPPFLSLYIEGEFDTEATIRSYFPTFSRWVKGVIGGSKK